MLTFIIVNRMLALLRPIIPSIFFSIYHSSIIINMKVSDLRLADVTEFCGFRVKIIEIRDYLSDTSPSGFTRDVRFHVFKGSVFPELIGWSEYWFRDPLHTEFETYQLSDNKRLDVFNLHSGGSYRVL